MLGISGAGQWMIFILYMFFCVNHNILVTWTQDKDKGYGYNATAAILHTDVLKLLTALSVALCRKSLSDIIEEVSRNMKVCVLYLIPSLLYVLNNNLVFVNLQYFDPTSYYILLQLRVVVSGVVYQVLFNRKLSTKQWLSLVVLMCGCMLQRASVGLDSGAAEDGGTQRALSAAYFRAVLLNRGSLFLALQIACSTVAGVYTELLVKQHSKDVDFWVQNAFMYLDSLVGGLLVFAAWGQPYQRLFCLHDGGVSYTQRLKIGAVIVNMAAMGLVTALFLKFLNSIVKNSATALEVIITAFASWLMFSTQISVLSMIAMMIIVFSIYIYSTNPLQQLPVTSENLCRKKVSVSESDNHM